MQLNYQGKNIVVIGLGVTGRSCLDYFLSKNVIPKGIDTRLNLNELDQISDRIPIHLGSLNESWILDADLIVISPGLSVATPIIAKAIQKGIEVIGDVELFCRELNQTDQKIIAITGSNGKTTVTSLIYEILKQAGFKVAVGGNIGDPVLSLLKLKVDYFVLELSSFQLETTFSLHAEIAIILNITEDHTDRYPEGFGQYIAAKQRIYQHAQTIIYNIDDKNAHFNLSNQEKQKPQQISFGLTQGDYCFDETLSILKKHQEPIMPLKQLQLKGIHNGQNTLVALAVGDLLKINRTQMIQTLSTFVGLSHRYESIGFFKAIEFINDSKATNVGSTIAALKGAQYQGRLHLLLGGDGKGADFMPLRIALLEHQLEQEQESKNNEPQSKKEIQLYCYGQDKAQLAKLLPKQTQVTETLQEALIEIQKKAQSGDLVLLSPACASLDQFKNYAERGDQFTQLVQVLFK